MSADPLPVGALATGEIAEGGPGSSAIASDAVDVTVVVPCYDVEGSVGECVEGVRRNNRIALEVICIDDGSTDGTAEVLARLAADDSRIRVVSKPNGGYGAAVNRGFAEARGTYVAVAEPDDYPAAHMYDDLYELAESLDFPDVVKSSYWRLVPQADGGERRWHNDYYRALGPERRPFTLAERPEILRHHPSIWSALYRRAFLEGEGIRFKEVPGAGWVDNPFSVEVLARARTIVYTDEPYYHYREDLPGSSTVTLPWRTRFERWHDMLDVLEHLGEDDPGILSALYAVGFRHVERALAAHPEGSPEHGAVLAAARRIFERMDLDLVARLDGVPPGLRRYPFVLRGERPVPLDGLAHARSLVGLGIRSLRANGPAFTLDTVARNASILKGRLLGR